MFTITYEIVAVGTPKGDRFEVHRAAGKGLKAPLTIGTSQRPRHFLSGKDAKSAIESGSRADIAAASRLGLPARFVDTGAGFRTVYVDE